MDSDVWLTRFAVAIAAVDMAAIIGVPVALWYGVPAWLQHGMAVALILLCFIQTAFGLLADGRAPRGDR